MNILAPNNWTEILNNTLPLLLKRMLFPIHPSVPMRKGDQNGQTFRIDRIRNPGCSLDKDTYNVVKKEFNYFDNYDGKNVFKISFSATTDSSSDDFFNLGYSLCSPGWIEQVFVHG